MFGLRSRKEPQITIVGCEAARSRLCYGFNSSGIVYDIGKSVDEASAAALWIDAGVLLNSFSLCCGTPESRQAEIFYHLRGKCVIIWVEDLPDKDLRLLDILCSDLRAVTSKFVFVAASARSFRHLKVHLEDSVLYPDIWQFPLGDSKVVKPKARKLQIGIDLERGLSEAMVSMLGKFSEMSDVILRIWDPEYRLREADVIIFAHWTVYRSSPLSYGGFLGLLDVLFVTAADVYGLLRAQCDASGVICFLEDVETGWSDGTDHLNAQDCLNLLQRYVCDSKALRREQRKRRQAIARASGAKSYSRNLRKLLKMVGLAGGHFRVQQMRCSENSVLFVSTNGIGLGHITRLIAVANACQQDIKPVFAVFSAGVRMVEDAGYHCEHMSSNEYLGLLPKDWHQVAACELEAIIRFHKPKAILYDGNVLYDAVSQAMSSMRVPLIWLRRGFFKKTVSSSSLKAQSFATYVIEPGEAAADYDQGPSSLALETFDWPRCYKQVSPVSIVGAKDFLTRNEARQKLSINDGGLKVLIQVGAGNLRDTEMLLDRLIGVLQQHDGVEIFVAQWPIADRPPLPRADVRILRRYPLSPCLRAFDFVISAAGYNSFHELLMSRVPAIFIANKFTRLDDQVGRSRYAVDQGLALQADMETTDFNAVIGEMMSQDVRERLRARLACLSWSNGAVDIADLLSECIKDAI
ncbi:hypothetical protein UF64_06980 [Thalassospira sp. HJ]|uniref:hypothetical protein n=1 Tax=Thalassospira sp. HJ TaxID=1616823 RepID=UPI0005CE4C79|nr:hypothetical protein [Thalassospira sp. HJ]KJE35849.1 hypothetical protein UF64_06980 [Thalassospira sp. HJ]